MGVREGVQEVMDGGSKCIGASHGAFSSPGSRGVRDDCVTVFVSACAFVALFSYAVGDGSEGSEVKCWPVHACTNT